MLYDMIGPIVFTQYITFLVKSIKRTGASHHKIRSTKAVDGGKPREWLPFMRKINCSFSPFAGLDFYGDYSSPGVRMKTCGRNMPAQKIESKTNGAIVIGVVGQILFEVEILNFRGNLKDTFIA